MKSSLLTLLLALAPLAEMRAITASDFISKAEQWMSSLDEAERKAAYRSWLQMGPEVMAEYEKSLVKVKTFHSKQLTRLASTSGRESNPYLVHEEIASELDAERERVLPLIRTDWKKDGKKIKMLREEMEDLFELWERANRIARKDTSKLDAQLDSHLAALSEISREMERFDEEAYTTDLDDDELREYLLDENLSAGRIIRARTRLLKTRNEIERLEETSQTNKNLGAWCTGAMQGFTETLNAERVVLGLKPLVIEEKLSVAAEGHSDDMAKLGFFSHESPVPGKKTPWDRARKAEFQGSANGENIFMGSTSPQAAYNAWFASDGHRLIMMNGGPNVIGVGISGKHWTMMTGNL